MRTQGRVVAVGLMVALVAVCLGGCMALYVPPTPKASVEITSTRQDYYEYFQEWSDYVYVYFNIENTGSVDIDYYEVYLEVQCEGGAVYQDWTNGLNVRVGKKLSDWTMCDTGGERVLSVTVSDVQLTSYSY